MAKYTIFGGKHMWYDHKFFKYSFAILIILLIIFMLGKINFFLAPFITMAQAVFMPLLVSGLLYYIMRPIIRFMIKRWRLPKTISIIAVFLLIMVLVAIIGRYTGSIIAHQFNEITSGLSFNFETAREKTSGILNNQWLQSLPLEDLSRRAAEILEDITQNLSRFIFGFFSTITNIGTTILIVPFILFYFLKDDDKFSPSIVKLFPGSHRKNVEKILGDIDESLSSYIAGQMTVALAVGILMYIGYTIIGLRYALILGIFAMITSIIPFFGPWIGIIPAALVALSINAFMVLKVLITMLVVQQIDGSFISPNVMGKRLSVHPVTIVLLLMSAVSVYGFVGILIAVPVYAALKATIRNIHSMYFSRCGGQ